MSDQTHKKKEYLCEEDPWDVARQKESLRRIQEYTRSIP